MPRTLLVLLLLATGAHAASVPSGLSGPPAATVEEGGRHWRLRTNAGPLHVWVPARFDPATAGVVVYVHGYRTEVDVAWARDLLARQFRASGRNAMFLAPQSPRNPSEPVPWPSVGALLDEARAAGLPVPPRGDLVLVGHSGAWRSLANWVGTHVRQAILLDALYDGEAVFRGFVARGGRLVLVSQGTMARARRFLTSLRGTVAALATRVGVPETATAFRASERQAGVLHLESQYGHAAIMQSGRVLPVLLEVAPLPAVAAGL